MIWLFDNQDCRVAFARAYGHQSTNHVRKEHNPPGYEAMRFSRWTKHPTLGPCLVGSFLSGIGMFDVHFPIMDVRAATPEEMHHIVTGNYVWGSGRVDHYTATDFIGIAELGFILGTEHKPECEVSHQYDPRPPEFATDDSKHLRPSKRAIHQAVRNVMYNELGLTRTGIRATMQMMVQPIAEQYMEERMASKYFEGLILNALVDLVWQEQRRPATTTRYVRTDFADRIRNLVASTVAELVGKHVRIALNITPEQLVEAGRTRAIDLGTNRGESEGG
jgi:hypothetical protein